MSKSKNITKTPGYYRDLLEDLTRVQNWRTRRKIFSYLEVDEDTCILRIPVNKTVNVSDHDQITIFRITMWLETSSGGDEVAGPLTVKWGVLTPTTDPNEVVDLFNNDFWFPDLQRYIADAGFSARASNDIQLAEYGMQQPFVASYDADHIADEIKDVLDTAGEDAEQEQDEIDRKRMREL
jgi:hypothetical protein